MTGETPTVRPYVLRYCQGRGVDVGCGEEKIDPEAIGLDLPTTYGDDGGPQTAADVLTRWEDWKCRAGSLDYVYSSHLLEDYADPGAVLGRWLKWLKPGGHLVLCLPDEQRYREHCASTGQCYNGNHVQAWGGPDAFAAQFPELRVVDSGELEPYSFYVVVQKPARARR